MAARDREEILTRYRRLREISTRHHSAAWCRDQSVGAEELSGIGERSSP